MEFTLEQLKKHPCINCPLRKKFCWVHCDIPEQWKTQRTNVLREYWRKHPTTTGPNYKNVKQKAIKDAMKRRTRKRK